MSNPQSLRRPVFLVGYRATGKTTVGRILARRLDVPFVDTDSRIEASLGFTIAECFARHGEASFRDRESACLAAIIQELRATGGPCVVSTGGGIVLRPENVRLMRELGRVVWMKASLDTIRGRLKQGATTATSRPALRGTCAVDEVEDVLRARSPMYRAAAHVELETCEEHSPPQSADLLVKALEQLEESAEY